MYVDPGQRYLRLEEIGRGGQGVAYKAERVDTNEHVAIKLIRLCQSQTGRQLMRREILNHWNLTPHPNIIGFKEVFQTQEHLGIVLEYSSGGPLSCELQQFKHFDEGLARFYFQQLTSGLQHLHRQGVCHRDIKLENILIQKVGDIPILKICDFGYCKSDALDSVPNSLVGTMQYLAPEVLMVQHPQNASNDPHYDGKAADVWSLGVVLYCMLAGRFPFNGGNHVQLDAPQLAMKIIRAEYEMPQGISEDAQDMISRMFERDPKQRITVERILEHKFYQKKLSKEIKFGYPLECGITAAEASSQTEQQIINIMDSLGRVTNQPLYR